MGKVLLYNDRNAQRKSASVVHVSEENGLTDTFGAERFIAQHGGNWRFDHDQKQWFTFDTSAKRWRHARPGEVDALIIEQARDYLRQVQSATFTSDKARSRAEAWG